MDLIVLISKIIFDKIFITFSNTITVYGEIVIKKVKFIKRYNSILRSISRQIKSIE